MSDGATLLSLSMRIYALHGLTRYAANAVDRELGDHGVVALLSKHQDDDEGLVTELRRLVAATVGQAPEADVEFVAAALDSVDWNQLVSALRELVDVKIELPCHHGKVTLESFGGYDVRHGDEREIHECFERHCPACGYSWRIELRSSSNGPRNLLREFTFTPLPQPAVYREHATFNNGELATSTSGMWVSQPTRRRQRV